MHSVIVGHFYPVVGTRLDPAGSQTLFFDNCFAPTLGLHLHSRLSFIYLLFFLTLNHFLNVLTALQSHLAYTVLSSVPELYGQQDLCVCVLVSLSSLSLFFFLSPPPPPPLYFLNIFFPSFLLFSSSCFLSSLLPVCKSCKTEMWMILLNQSALIIATRLIGLRQLDMLLTIESLPFFV